MVCDSKLGEDAASCPNDCLATSCGDQYCDERHGEDYTSCPQDCQASECESDIQCVGKGSCDYVVGQEYPTHGENVFNVCACKAGLCEITVQAKGLCGDGICLNEACNPNSTSYCASDCGTCKQPDLVIETASVERQVVHSGDKVKLDITVNNLGAVKSKPFTVKVYLREGDKEKEVAEFKSAELPITRLAVDYADLVGYLAASRERRIMDGLAWLQGAFPVNVPPNAVLIASPFYGVRPLNVLFDAGKTVSETGPIVRYEMDFDGDGTFDVSFEPPATQVSHLYEEAGLYVATLKAVTKAGVGGLDSVRILALEQPVRQVVELDTTGLCDEVTFVVSIEEVGNTEKSNNTREVDLFIICQREPLAVVKATPQQGLPPVTISFDGTASRDEDGTLTAYAWDFGDGQTSEQALAQHTYTKNGEYLAKLKVTDNDGLAGEAKQAIVVGEAPVAVLAVNILGGKPPLKVSFSAAKSLDADGQIDTYEWDFGDGSQATGMEASHVFEKYGEYTATLRVRDNDGIHASAEQVIVAGVKPKAHITAQEKTYAGLRTVFDATASTDDESIAAYKWEFDDGTSLDGSRVTHSFSDIGVQKVKLQVIDNTGLKDVAEAMLNVFGSDAADLRGELVEPKGPLLVQNQDYDLKFKVLNAGEKGVGAFKVSLHEESLRNPPLGKAQVEGLGPLEARELSFRVNAGERLRERKFYLSLDTDKQNKESNEINNVLEVVKVVVLMEICGNDFDDDVDGYVDEGCTAEGAVEVCGNRLDDDSDKQIDEGCKATEAVISGLALQVSFDKPEPLVGEEQVVRVSHPLLGELREATVSVVSPQGNVLKLLTDKQGVARYRVEEPGAYVVEATKYTLVTEKGFRGVSETVALQRQLLAAPATLFGDRVFEFPLLVMVLLLLSIISMVLAYDRSAALFREELELTKSPAEQAREKGLRLVIALGFFFVPLVFNKGFGFEAGIAAAIVEIIVLYLTMHFERERF